MMNTFLPSTSFEQSAKWLDNVRLSKQRVECLQILQALTNPEYGWQNHPAVNMWRGYEAALIEYGLIICKEWINRGYKDTCAVKIADFTNLLSIRDYECYWFGDTPKPPWLTEEFASNHRAILLGKVDENYKIAYTRWTEAIYGNTDNKEHQKSRKQLEKATQLMNWYDQFNWPEQPAQRVNDKWPYLWPEGEKIENLP